MSWFQRPGDWLGQKFQKFSDAVLAPVFGRGSKIGRFSQEVAQAVLPNGASGNFGQDLVQGLQKGFVEGGLASVLEKKAAPAMHNLHKAAQIVKAVPLVGAELAADVDQITAKADEAMKFAKDSLELGKEIAQGVTSGNVQPIGMKLADAGLVDRGLVPKTQEVIDQGRALQEMLRRNRFKMPRRI
jgi:hypothetical protein